MRTARARSVRPARPHEVAVLAVHGVVPLDLAIPCAVFAHARTPDGAAPYRLRVCGETRDSRSSALSIRAPGRLADLSRADTVVVPGIEDLARPVSRAVVEALQEAWRNGSRIASICSGAFLLAAAGLLDGRRATTHWAAAAELARRFPRVEVDPKVLFVDEGRIVTSAGLLAGVDMCLHLVRRDHGQVTAARSARLAVAPLERDGGQAQFIEYDPPGSAASLAPLLAWMAKNLHLSLPIDALAEKAGTSPRTLARRFREQTGTTPLQWLHVARVRRARELLETSTLGIEEIASAAGFESAVTFRTCFRRVVGVSPSAYRATFARR